MNRREFIKKGSAAITIAAVAGFAGSLNKLLAGQKSGEHFSLEIITDMPAKAVKLAEEFFNTNTLSSHAIKFSEYPLEGEYFADIVFVNKKKLVNYKKGNDNINLMIRDIASSLELPKKVLNPVRIKFSTANENCAAERFLIFHKDILVKSVPADGNIFNETVKGTRGNITLNFDSNRARVVSTSCTHKICVNTGSISLSGESITCIPNEILILAE